MKNLLVAATIFLWLISPLLANAASVEDELAEKIKTIEVQLQRLKSQLEPNNKPQMLSSKDKKWQIESYGNLLYKSHQVFKNTQDVTPQRRSLTDLERVIFELGYQFDQQWQMEVELEYEHGGTGASLEYDGLDEFGEFETEIEAGGEVLVEKLEFSYQVNPNVEIKFGHIYLPVGLGTELHKPDQYFTTERHWSEATLIPQVWHETGINFVTQWRDFSLQTLVTTGLNSEYFRTYNWVANGHQKRFEQVNADDLALTLRLDYGNTKSGSGIGFSYYQSDSTDNRNKMNKLDSKGTVRIYGVHGVFRQNNWRIQGQYLYGELSDSLAITQANKTTPGLQPGNFAQLGSEAEAAMLEVAYNTQQLFSLAKPLYLFSTYQYANPLKNVLQGNASEHFNRQEITLGVNYFPSANLVLKAQYAEQDFQQAEIDNTNGFSLAIGYQFEL